MFLGSPDLVHSRSFSRLWNLGHIAAFTVWSLLLLRHWAGLAARPFRVQAVTVLLFCLLAGGTVELIQSLSGRYSSLADMGRNVLGGLTALLFLFPGRLSIKTSLLRRWQIVTLALLLIALAPLVRSFIDE
jgi:VanZ family protein